ncbi:hypothetical protein WA026_004757 [Henosepilachna vigintioctopunctata]|uniref:Uncharacterized protein n=1 Tax=Henosepilachna vigintioctopunctata TaxID=420089 RepID=A0AAW1V495_9CUCU
MRFKRTYSKQKLSAEKEDRGLLETYPQFSKFLYNLTRKELRSWFLSVYLKPTDLFCIIQRHCSSIIARKSPKGGNNTITLNTKNGAMM